MMDLQSDGTGRETTTVEGVGDAGPTAVAPVVAPAAGIDLIDAAPDPLPPDLARVVAAWPDLPDPVRAGVLAMVAASGG